MDAGVLAPEKSLHTINVNRLRADAAEVSLITNGIPSLLKVLKVEVIQSGP